jgi:hypothetical protein
MNTLLNVIHEQERYFQKLIHEKKKTCKLEIHN